MKIVEPLDFARPIDGIEAFTTLRGDVSADDSYSAFNVCDYTGDTPAHIAECRQQLCASLGIEAPHLIMPRQSHTSNVATITSLGEMPNLQNIDALVTNLTDVAIGVNTADCVPVVLADPAAGIIGVAHAGWKGTKMRIASRTVEAMCLLGALPERIMAAIGAAICQDCFEVGDEVVAQFAEAGFNVDAITKRSAATGKAHINLPEANRICLIQSGLRSENIALSHRCTRCNPERYFSARRLGINSGRTFTCLLRRS